MKVLVQLVHRYWHTLPTLAPFCIAGGLIGLCAFLTVILSPLEEPNVSVAFVGNSMQYYNDMPRLMESLADSHIVRQNSCLHGNADFETILIWGNGMYNKWSTGSARINFNHSSPYDGEAIYDFGACTVRQLLTGRDPLLEQRVCGDGNDGNGDDDQYNNNNDDVMQQFMEYDDERNPCLQNNAYYKYTQDVFSGSAGGGGADSYVWSSSGSLQWDFVVLNDNTRSAARTDARASSLKALEQYFVPWLEQSNATPILISTYGYWSPYRDMGGLVDVPTFTSLTFAGYKEYAQLLAEYLPDSQQPKVAPVGIAFLMVWEENHAVWSNLFHIDYVHCSPAGTFLQALVVYHTMFGRMPKRDRALRPDLSSLWNRARRFQPAKHRRMPFPTPAEAQYLYHVAVRVCVYGQRPSSFKPYQNGESADWTPTDDLYRVDDLF